MKVKDVMTHDVVRFRSTTPFEQIEPIPGVVGVRNFLFFLQEDPAHAGVV